MSAVEWGGHEPDDKPKPYKKVYWTWGSDEENYDTQEKTLYLIHTLDDTFVIQRGLASPVSEALQVGPVFTDLHAAKMFYLLTN